MSDNGEMLRFRETDVFSRWITELRDARAKAHIVRRLARAMVGNFGDVAPVGDGISEMRIDVGTGYRVYYRRQGLVVYVLLCGGDKASQARDIVTAKRLWGELKGKALK
ncbi:type II toxin-antitoxin system RelE/ParE family toxin [Achromobacter xylosoxidans]|uniref:type II toxin-antitoxin system RelE/ParE family toxin n=2 Tax=Alcaligenes xylosoxydans xylosoxydans TaxID=85698 RepID=UPI002AB0DB05|nr:type II toxin-antitoxin system RelE/ParE family toxin [Achromobacter xylosoxidans]